MENDRVRSLEQENVKANDIDPVPTVLVTGFGPFRNHVENSSWLTVKELVNIKSTEYNLITRKLSVEYDVVTQAVPKLWVQFTPKLVVHCGVSDQANCLTLEKVAHNDEYHGCDVQGLLPPNNSCCKDGPVTLCTALDIDKVLEDANSSKACIKAEASENAGRYLCEFIYYTSLRINRNTAFVHVPPVDQPYSAREMAQGLNIIISSMLKQLKDS